VRPPQPEVRGPGRGATRARRRLLHRTVAGCALLAVLSGCGLPLDSGVQVPGPVAGDAQEPGAVQKLPPGPQADAGPRAIVQGFLSAQSNPDDGHAIARQFLAPEIRDTWSDDQVLIRTPAVEIAVDPADESVVTARAEILAAIGEDGSYQLVAERREDTYRLRRDDAGQLRLVEVPDGLRLTPADAASSFRPMDVYFLQDLRAREELPRLVPDRVFLPADDDPSEALVRSLLDGPSVPLGDAVTTAFPAGTELRQPVSTADGVVTVDLTGPVAQASTEERRHLSAQLVWTLRGAGQLFSSLRLLVDGEPLPVEGAGQVQDRDAWAAYDPTLLEEGGALLSVRDGRLQALSGTAPPSEATDGRLPVEAVVSSPLSGALALLSTSPDGEGDVVRTGPPRGPFSVALSGGEVRSMSWGSGQEGLWVVVSGASPQVLLVADAEADGRTTTVPFTQPVGAGPLSSLRVSRDGARAAAVFGLGADRQLYVGRVERSSDGVRRLAGFQAVAPPLTDVADVAWESGTSLVALGVLGTATRLPVRVAVDGSELEPVRSLGLDGEPESVAVAPGRPLVVGTVLADRRVLFVEDGGLFREPVPGIAPAYPG
jgi:hypothetical protein